MHIRSIRIRNVRGFDAVDLDLRRPDGSLAGWTVFAGRNGSGKSTLLRALALAVVGPTPARSLQESFGDWIRSGAEEAEIELDLIPASGDEPQPVDLGRLAFGGSIEDVHADGTIVTVLLRWKSVGPGEPLQGANIAYHEPPPKKTYFGLWSEKTDAGPWSENTGGWFLAGYGPFRRLSGHGADAIRLMSGPKRVRRLVSLFREDASLVDCVLWLRELYPRRLEGDTAAKKLIDDVIALLNDGLMPDGVRIDRLDSKGLWVEQHDTRLSLEALSDGYRTAAALVMDVVRHLYDEHGQLQLHKESGGRLSVTNEGVVLIDEMDLHLHVSWQQRIGFWLKDHFPQVQFLVTTHSPFICQAADPGGLIRLPVPGEGRAAERVPDEVYYTVIHGTADDSVLSELFGLDPVHSERAESFHARLAELEVRHRRGEASAEEEAELEKLRGQLPRGPLSDVDQVLRRLAVK